MPDNIHLIIHDAIGIISALVTTAVIFFVLLNDHKKKINVILSLSLVAVVVFLISHVWGASVADHELSRQIFMWNVSVIFICVLNFHTAMLALNRDKALRWAIWMVYIIGAAFVATFLIYPDTFILESASKMYFPNYYVPGTLHWLMRLVFQIIIPIYFIYEFVRGYKHAADTAEHNRLMYFGLAFATGWILGFIPIPLIFGIPIDPMWGLLFPIVFSIPFTYAVLRYDLMDIKVIAKKAFLYGVAFVGIGFLVALFDFTSQWIQLEYPNFPIWIAPVFIAIFITAIGVVIWNQLREGEILKYEFITTVTHKFRTPLTHIKWAAENLRESSKTPEEVTEQIGYIEGANAKLVELTDLLSNASETDENLYKYKLERLDISTFTDEVVQAAIDHLNAKAIPVVKQIPPGIFAIFDTLRLRFVLQTIVENAINYTPKNSPITVTVAVHGKNVIVSVKDSGIGIQKTELPLIFTKLYRGKRARAVDTEGMGIGLFIAKEIITRLHGKIWVESGGENMGSTFSFSVPLAK